MTAWDSRMLFEIHKLTRRYDGVNALDIPQLSFEEGRIYGLIGPNGAGKTTLLEILAGIMPATTGTVLFKGEAINTSAAALSVRRRLTYLSQNPVLFQGNVIENVEYGLKVRGVGRTQRRERALRALEQVELSALARRAANTLSAGERQRAALARAVCIDPECILLDEPTANVDQQSSEVVCALIRRLNAERGMSILFTSHDLNETLVLSDEIVALRDGRLVVTPVVNLFGGEIEHEGERAFLRVSDAVRIEIVSDRVGKGKITINPQGIVISREALESSARNRFRGVITRIEQGGHLARVTVDCGILLVSEITQTSREEMGLAPGMHVFISFKSTSVMVY